jgi:hypothetical protein
MSSSTHGYPRELKALYSLYSSLVYHSGSSSKNGAAHVPIMHKEGLFPLVYSGYLGWGWLSVYSANLMRVENAKKSDIIYYM